MRPIILLLASGLLIGLGAPMRLASQGGESIVVDGQERTFQVYVPPSVKAPSPLLIVLHGGHTWPGGRQHLPLSVVGRTSRDFDAGQVIWAFFGQKQ